MTGQTAGDLMYAIGTTTWGRIAAVAVGSYVKSAGTGTVPAWASLLDLRGFGTHNFIGTGTGAVIVNIENTSAGTTNYAALTLTNNNGSVGQIRAWSSTYTESGIAFQNSLAISADNANGMSLAATHSAGTVRFYSGGSTLRASFDATGHFIPGADNTYNLGTAVTMRWKDIFAVTKTSSLNVSWGSGSVLVSVLEGPEYRLYDTGTVTLDAAGHALVHLDPHYVEITSLIMPYQVLTSGASVLNKTASSFTLSGSPLVSVDWMIIATRAGFENVRWRDPQTEAKEPLGLSDPWHACKTKHPANNTAHEPKRCDRPSEA